MAVSLHSNTHLNFSNILYSIYVFEFLLFSEEFEEPSLIVLGISGQHMSSEYPPDLVASITGVPVQSIYRLASEFARNRPAIALGGRGASMHSNGPFNQMAIHALNALVGSIERPGGALVQIEPPLSPLPQVVQDDAAIHGSKFMPQWTTTFKPQQIWDLVAYTRFLHRKKGMQGNVVKGRRTFQVYCAFCHGGDGKGQDAISRVLNPPPTDLTDRSRMGTLTDADLYFTILGGGEAVGHSDFMPTWGEVLTENEIRDLIAFIGILSGSSD